MSEITAGTLRAALVIAEAEIERLREENSCLISQRVEAEAEIERLQAALRDCADDLEVYVENHYQGSKQYPGELRRYERDIEPVRIARAALEGK